MSFFVEGLPQGDAAALMKNVSYNVPGIFLCSKLIYLLMDMVEEKFGYRIPIEFIYGAPQLKWNGGRLILNHYDNSFSLSEVEKEFVLANKRGIRPLLTFSNTTITKDDLSDRKSNDVLKMVNDNNGGVIVTSELLHTYIKDLYPDISVHASVIKTAYEKNRDKSYYSDLSGNYDYYVIHPDDNFNKELLECLPKENAEIILNERCFYRCEMRTLHYDSISAEQITQSNNNYQNRDFLKNCAAMPEEKQSYSNRRNISLTVPEVKQLHDLGYNLFKIQGRTDSLNLFFFDLMRYTLENEIAFPNMYAIFTHQIDKFVKGVL